MHYALWDFFEKKKKKKKKVSGSGMRRVINPDLSVHRAHNWSIAETYEWTFA